MINKALLFMFFCFLLAACSGSDGDVRDIPAPDSNNPEIRLKADVWQMMEGTRATTYDNAEALQSETSGFTCYAYTANSTTVNTDAGINGSNVKWNSTNSAWEFQDGPDPHRWPDSGSLDFFCYMPADPNTDANVETAASYISGISYDATDAPSVTHTVTFSCDMRETVDKEFVFALALDKNKSNAGSGVSLTFLHPFARIRFKLSEASGTNVKINSITLGGTYYKTADYSYDGSTSTWSNHDNADAFGECDLDENYLVIPNNYGSQTLTVNATWTELSAVENVDVSASVAFNWEAGHSYTYTLTLKDYILIVDTDKFTEQW